MYDLRKLNNNAAASDPDVPNVCVLGNRDAHSGVSVYSSREMQDPSGEQHAPVHTAWSFLSLLSGVVGARNLTMECRKGRRKGGAPILGSLLLAWLLTNGCAVVARNIGECEKIFTISDRGSLPRVALLLRESPPHPSIVTPIKGPATTRVDIYARRVP